jgi:hypothetical protein
VSEDFVAAAGFVPRVGYRKPQLRYFLDYQPKKYPWIRRFSPHVTWNAFYGFDGKVQSGGHWHFSDQLASGGRWFDRQQETTRESIRHLQRADGNRVVIPSGDYMWHQWTATISETRVPPSSRTSSSGRVLQWLSTRFDVAANVKPEEDPGSVEAPGRRHLPTGDFVSDLIP